MEVSGDEKFKVVKRAWLFVYYSAGSNRPGHKIHCSENWRGDYSWLGILNRICRKQGTSFRFIVTK